ncbi:MAG TPA: hypothetical protein VF147_12020 [Vicinamibacterales bacterium]
MDSTPPITLPVLTALDATTQAFAALCYLAIAAGALMRAPSDIRTRVFFAFGLANIAAFAIPSLLWWKGITDPAQAPRAATALVLAGLGVAALLLFHFTQVFPRRRPWIRTSGFQVEIGYGLIPLTIIGLVLFFPKDVANITPGYILGFLVFGFPLLVLLAVVLPVAAIVSLLKSYKESENPDLLRARVPLAMILIGQIAGGALAMVFAPALTAVAPNSGAVTVLTILMWILGLLTPFAFAAAVWKYDVLAIAEE